MGNLLGGFSDAETVVEEDGIAFGNGVLDKIVLIGLVCWIPVAGGNQRGLV